MISGFFQNCKIDSTYINIEDATVSGDTLSMGEIKKINNKIWFENITRIKTTIIKQETNYLIIDSACSKPKDAKISIFQPSTKKQKSQYNIESNTGKFQFVLPPDESYLVSYQAPGYMYKTTTVNAKEGGFKHMDFALNFDTLDNDFVEHQQMVFPIAEIHLTQQSEMEMQLLAAFLKMNPHLFVDIAGNLVNADSLLSIRSNSVADALTDHGIAPENIFSNLWPSKWGTDTLQITIFSSTHPKLQLLKEQKENRKIKPIKNSGLFVENILFEKEQFTLPNEEGLTDLINYLKANPECVVMIEGHSDMQGEYKANLNLSLKRALTVWKYLINNGVGKEQLLLRPMGNIRPIAVEKDAAGNILEEARKYNRRVEFHIIENTGTEEFQIKPIQVPESYRISQKK
ncbi:MAG TPA: hypothetical protein DCQ31_02805 [Bacteroidales bacterium]|nr:hypothetical protein [Bacteroidales bacterium]